MIKTLSAIHIGGHNLLTLLAGKMSEKKTKQCTFCVLAVLSWCWVVLYI